MSSLFIYSGSVSAEIFDSYYDKRNKRKVIKYNAQDNFSVLEIHRALAKNARVYRNLHLAVYVWDCQEKVDREYLLDFLYPRSKRRDVRACESNIKAIRKNLKDMLTLARRHKSFKSRLDGLKSIVTTTTNRIIQDQTTHSNIQEMKRDPGLYNLENSMPVWYDLSEKTKEFLTQLKIKFSKDSVEEQENPKIEELIGDIHIQIKELRKNNDLETKNNQQAVLFFQGIIDSLGEIKSKMSEEERDWGVELKAFFKNYKEFSIEEREIPVHNLAMQIEKYSSTQKLRNFVNRWTENIQSFLLNESKDITVLNMNEKDSSTQALEKILNSIRDLRDFTDFLDSQFFEFVDLFIPAVLPDHKVVDVFNLPEDDQNRLILEVREFVQNGHIPVYASEWFDKKYISYNSERVNTFLDYADSIQDYLVTLEEQIRSQYKEKILRTFMGEVIESIQLGSAMNPSVQVLLNKMLDELSVTLFFNSEEERELLNQVKQVSDLFFNLRDAVDNKYYGSPFYVITEYIKSKHSELSLKAHTLNIRITEDREDISKAQTNIVKAKDRLFKLWKMDKIWLPALVTVPGFNLSYTLYYYGRSLNKED